MRKILFALASVLFFGQFSAQLVVTNDLTPEDYVLQVLLGEGVTATNITFNAAMADVLSNQCGEFDGVNSNIGMEAGVILSTGDVSEAPGPNDGAGGDGSALFPVDTEYENDVDLLAIAGEDNINDNAVLEFDFVPQGDTLRFNYVFASEEYPEFVNQFNDAFGFFLAGPGISGIYSAPAEFPAGSANIAVVPDVNIPVTINNVNNGTTNCPAGGPDGPCTNCEYYVDNCGGETVEFDGFTSVLEAFAIVECGALYHIKLAIGDALDGNYNSAVFLEANSFSSEPSGLTLQTLFPLGLVEISETCDTAVARIGRQCDGDSTYYALNYLESDSSATYGVDYEALPDTIIMVPGQSDSIFGVVTISDGLEEGIEYLCIELSQALHPDSAWTVIDTACVPIIDSYTFDALANDQTMWCPEQIPSLNANPQFPGVAPFDYEWSLNGVSMSTDDPYNPPVPENYGDSVYYDLDVVDYCGAVNNPTSVLVANSIRSYPETNGVSVIGDYCPGIPYRLRVQFDGGTYPLSFYWSENIDGPYTEELQNYFVDPDATNPFQAEERTYYVYFEDACNPTRISDTTSYTLVPPTAIDVSTDMNNQICIEQELELGVVTSGGYPPFSYAWTAEPGLVPPVDFPFADGFSISAADGEGIAYGFYTIDGQQENPFDIVLQVNDWCTDQLEDSMITNYYNPTLESAPYTLSADIDSSITYQTVEALNCIFPNVVSANDDGMNDKFVVNELINRPGTMYIYNRWGNLLAETKRHEWSTGDSPEGTYFYVVKFDDGGDHKGHFTIVK